jgi:hypothetical protein
VPAVLLIGVVVAFAVSRPASYAAALVVGLAGSFVVLITLVISLSGYVGRLRSSSFGLLAGTATAPSRRNILDLMAGVPASTAPRSVIPWLNDCLSQLAGLPEGEVLRFGHLWLGTAFSPLRLRPSEKPPQEVQHLGDPDYRLVNLELMTTDLTRQRPYRFPLPCRTEARPTEPGHAEDYDQLWVCLEQLTDGDCQMFPDEVLAVLAEGESRNVRDRSGTDRTLHRLPDPWDLPVIFAVRLSMALPALFQAVRMYRMVEPAPVHDDFGRAIAGEDGTELMFPRPSAPLAEEVWFSDGGITSNFPVHFFDASLPRWPTVSLNLGRHPDSAPQQDVSLPQDWDPDNIPEQPLSDSGLSLASGVFNTAMSWRDNLQSSMPGYRNRIAQVRTRSNEGGTNLFMPREVVASMALRGALAGARLRTRFHDDSQWDRFRWLRLRVAVSNVERLRQSVQERQIFYADALSGPKWVDHQRDTFCDQPRKATIDWYKPDDSYWPAAAELLSTFAAAYQQPSDRNGPDDADSPDDPVDTDVMTAGVATPMPVLRQVPRE